MEPFEETLLAVRHAPAATSAGLADAARRGRRRRTLANAGIGAATLAVVAGIGTAVVSAANDAVVTPVATASPRTEPSMVVVGRPHGWDSAVVGADGRTMSVHFGGGTPNPDDPCHYGVRARVVETADTVTVTLDTLVRADRTATSRVCTARRYARSESFTLDAPLGGRRLVDGSNGKVHTPSGAPPTPATGRVTQ